MTNFIQPIWTLKASDGATQNPQYQRLPRTQASQNSKAYGRDEAITFQYKTMYPESKPHRVNYSNVRPTTVTPALNTLTGNHLRAVTMGNDPRADNTKSKPISFNIIKEFEEQKERTLGFGDYTTKLYGEKESFIDVSKNNIDIEFSTIETQTITGIYDSRGMSGKMQLEINGPKSMMNTVKYMETGFFTTNLLIDKEWPTGTYKISGIINGEKFGSVEFTIKNFSRLKSSKKISVDLSRLSFE